MSEKITTASRLHLDALSAGKVDALDDCLSDSLVAHFLPPETTPGPEAIKDFCRAVRAVFPDLTYTVDDAIVDGDLVAIRVTGRGTQTGAIGGIPATGKQAKWSEMHFLRIDGDKVVEIWGVVDQLSALQQLGGISAKVPKLVIDSAAPQITIPGAVVELLADYASYGT